MVLIVGLEPTRLSTVVLEATASAISPYEHIGVGINPPPLLGSFTLQGELLLPVELLSHAARKLVAQAFTTDQIGSGGIEIILQMLYSAHSKVHNHYAQCHLL